MPYIAKPERESLSDLTDLMEDTLINDPGELNYLITSLVISYITARPESYKIYNDAIGALESAKLELYRRKVIPYENLKIQTNGDVYETFKRAKK